MKSEMEDIVKLPEYQGCFACGQDNEKGLHLEFYFDRNREQVFSEFTLPEHFRGFERIIHGGIVSVILDEVMAWTAMQITGEITVTTAISVKFIMPVMPDAPYRAEGRVTGTEDGKVNVSACIIDMKGKMCAESESVFTILRGKRADRMKEKLNIRR